MKIIVSRDVYSSNLKTKAADYMVSHPRRQHMLQPISEVSASIHLERLWKISKILTRGSAPAKM
jgi:hypothetical protein